MLARKLMAASGATAVPIEYVQSQSGTGVSLAFSASNAAGNFIVVAVRWNEGTVSSTAIIDTVGNTYQSISTGYGGGGFRSALWYAENVGAGTNTITASFSDTVNTATVHIIIVEYSGVAKSGAFDRTNASTAPSGELADSGLTDTTRKANSLLIGYAWMNASVSNFTFTTGELQRQSQVSRFFLGDRVVDELGQYNTAATWTTSRAYGIRIATFRGQ
jgi:hypothetical protein